MADEEIRHRIPIILKRSNSGGEPYEETRHREIFLFRTLLGRQARAETESIVGIYMFGRICVRKQLLAYICCGNDLISG